MGDLAEDRVYDDRAAATTVYAAGSMGVAAVDVSGEQIGRFRLDHECAARDLASGRGDLPGILAVATDADVLVCREGAYHETGFGPAVAVAVDGADLLAAGPDGDLGRVVDAAAELPALAAGEGLDWLSVAAVDGTVRAMDGPLVGASDGVYRFTADGIHDSGLADVRDVSAPGVPLAATAEGCYRLGNGWMAVLEGPVDAVAGEPAAADAAVGSDGEGTGPGRVTGALSRAHAAAGEVVYEYRGGGDGADGWVERPAPGAVVALAQGERTYALTDDGALLVDREDGWARRTIGLADPAALGPPDHRAGGPRRAGGAR